MKAGCSSELDDHLKDKPKTGLALGLAEAPASHDRILEHGARGVDRGHSSRSMRSISSRLGGAKSAAKSSAMGR